MMPQPAAEAIGTIDSAISKQAWPRAEDRQTAKEVRFTRKEMGTRTVQHRIH